MTETAVDKGTQIKHEHLGQRGGENAGGDADRGALEKTGLHADSIIKQGAGGTRKPVGVRFLSEFIADIPETRRVRFITHLKEAIRDGQFDGCPAAETFELTYSRRGSEGPEQCGISQREFVVEDTSAFKTWLANEVTAPHTGPKYPTRLQFDGGQVSLADMAAKFRQRGSSSQKRKGKK